VSLKSEDELALMREAGRIVAEALEIAARATEPGATTADLDALAEAHIRRSDAIPSFKGYHGFPATLCTSINDEIVHGIPSKKRVLRAGDLLKLDCGAIYKGWHGDAAVTVIVGDNESGGNGQLTERRRLVNSTREALAVGIAAIRPDGWVADIGAAIETYAEGLGYGVVRKYCGHGIGRSLHEEPAVQNYGPAGKGPRLRPGMVICIEPMLNVGTGDTVELNDGWTVKTADGKLSAHFEHSVAVTEDGPRILTLP
jgi:methionyl aminopeptidase